MAPIDLKWPVISLQESTPGPGEGAFEGSLGPSKTKKYWFPNSVYEERNLEQGIISGVTYEFIWLGGTHGAKPYEFIKVWWHPWAQPYEL